jgi:hypothetical protein
MKKFLLVFSVLGLVALGNAQDVSSSTAQEPIADTSSYRIVQKWANGRKWERMEYGVDAFDELTTNVNSYIELGTGLHYKDSKTGEWTESSEQIEINPNGGARAIHGQHQAYFPADIYEGVIEIVTPDGKRLKSRPICVSYSDNVNSVLVSQLQHSIGLLLPSGNQVIYTNAFTDLDADLICTYRKSGFECDLVFRQAPPSPEAFGLGGANSNIELLTEFFDTQDPEDLGLGGEPPYSAISAQQPAKVNDKIFRFGGMNMVHGKAFLIGDIGVNNVKPPASSIGRTQSTGSHVDSQIKIPVLKSWLKIDGRTVLIEQVPFERAKSKLNALSGGGLSRSLATARSSLKPCWPKRHLPSMHLPKDTKDAAITLANTAYSKEPGLVLDYDLVNSSSSDFIFQGDTTYLIDGYVALGGLTTFEGGAVIKYVSTDNSTLELSGSMVCKTSPYRPVIFTSSNDNSVGDTISGSTGNPSGEQTTIDLNLDIPCNLSNAKFSYANTAVDVIDTPNKISDCQFTHCFSPIQIDLISTPVISIHNSLFASSPYCVYDGSGELTADVVHVTADVSNFVYWLYAPGAIALTNCIIEGTLGSAGIANTNSVAVVSGGFAFQSAGAGNYYLTAGSPYRNLGATNIPPDLLAELRQKTTYPPILYSNFVASVNLSFSPEAQRDTDLPDIGYHYDPIDYLVDYFWVTNATLTITNGAVIAGYNDSDLLITDGSSIVSVGLPSQPNWFTRYSAVQEQPIALGGGVVPGNATMVNPYHATNAPSGYFRFTKFSCPAGGGYHLYHGQANFAYSNLLVQDCEFWGGKNEFGGYPSTQAAIKNNLFVRSGLSAFGSTYTNNFLSFSNNLFWMGSFSIRPLFSSNYWSFFNNSFDHITNSFGANPQNMLNGYNAYIGDTNVTKRLSPISSTDVLISSLLYQSGPLGDFYQPTNSSLINTGSVTADLTGLFHYTTITNQVKETNSVVDIGYHYVAVNNSGYPFDSDGDGNPDYAEDSDGNGAADSGETDWQNFSDLGLRVFIARPKNNSLVP